MSDLTPSVIPLRDGLDLSTAKMLAEPGSLIDCLNMEVVDFLGYRRMDGYTRYDGNVYHADIPSMTVYTATCTTTGVVVTNPAVNSFVTSFANNIGYVFSITVTGVNTATVVFMPFTGQVVGFGGGVGGSWGFSVTSEQASITTVTQAQLITFETALRDLVEPLPFTACGLHWSQRNLYAVVPLLMIPYVASDHNQTVTYEISGTITNTFSAATAVLLDKVVTDVAGASNSERGYLIAQPQDQLSWSVPSSNTYTLGGAVSVGAGSIYMERGAGRDEDSLAASVYRAQRPSTYNFEKLFSTPGWVQIPHTYTARVTLTQIQGPFSALHRNDSEAEATYYFDDGVVASPIEFILLDYFVVSGSFDGGDAVVDIQFAWPGEDITTAFTMYGDAASTIDYADVTTRMSFNALPSFPQLKEYSSRYQFRTANFYATDGTTAIYGVNGAGRGFVIGPGGLSFIHTQNDATLDRPRHVENHLLHLALGFGAGSVQLSVVGQPTNFDGLEGASEHGVGDSLTGLMSLNGTTLGVFCSNSIWSITGSIVDNFQLQVISPKTGCIEYTLASCGEPYYLDSRGVCTLATSANYGDFVGSRVSDKVSSWLRPRLRQGVIGLNNAAGVACAMPVREKNQYRVYFNDGVVLTTTLRGEQETAAFTWQKLFLNQLSVSQDHAGIIPFAWTSEVDSDGKERVFVSHHNDNSTETSNQTYALECGMSFDGYYIPHRFDINWYFGETPAQFHTLAGLRLYGLSRGYSDIDVAVVGAQNDFDFSGATYSTTTAEINLPRTGGGIYSDFRPVTNRTDISGRGLALKLRFSGSNTNLALPEPSHVSQVLLTYSTPAGAFDL